MATLSGYAMPVSIPGINFFADHTYAQSDDGFSWPCWGRDSGGGNICQGGGDSLQADCISQTQSHAGLRYGINGVCHQTANRILYPAKILVSKARGYWLSSFLYGTYGSTTTEWLARISQCMQISQRPPSGGLPPNAPITASFTLDDQDENADGAPGERAYLNSVVNLYTETIKSVPNLLFSLEGKEIERDLSAQELALTVEYRLQDAAKEIDMGRLQTAQRTFLTENDHLTVLSMVERLKGETLSKLIDENSSKVQSEIYDTVGKDRFLKLFDFDFETDGSMNFVEPEIAVGEYD